MEQTSTAILYPTTMMVVYDTLISIRHSIQSWNWFQWITFGASVGIIMGVFYRG